MVARGQMVTLDSPGSIIMKMVYPYITTSKIKASQVFFFFGWGGVENIFGVWIKRTQGVY